MLERVLLGNSDATREQLYCHYVLELCIHIFRVFLHRLTTGIKAN